MVGERAGMPRMVWGGRVEKARRLELAGVVAGAAVARPISGAAAKGRRCCWAAAAAVDVDAVAVLLVVMVMWMMGLGGGGGGG
jgi:hypothetical protein